jgi:hypothetical protein
VLRNSCGQLLATKFKLKNTLGVIEKYGTDFKGNDRIAFIKPKYGKNP